MNPLIFLTLIITQLHPLKWSDFKGKPYTDDVALTASRIEVVSRETDGKVRWDTYEFFDRDSSFTRTDDQKILQHEQGHWCITQAYAEKIRRFLAPYQGCSSLKSKSVDIVIDQYIIQWKNTQKRYDKDTKHSINQYEQKKWDIKIQKLLKK